MTDTDDTTRRAISIRLSKEERAKLAAIAAAWGVPLAYAMRRLIREARLPAALATPKE